MALATLSIDMIAKIAKFEADMGQAARATEKAAQRINTSLDVAKSALSGLTAGISVGGLISLAKSAIDSVDALNDLRDATGASIENISALEDVAARTGTSMDTVSAGLIKFNKVLSDAKPGSDAAAALKSIGLNAEDLKRIDPAEALLKTAVALDGFATTGSKGRLVQELFGKSTRDLAAFLKDLAEQGKLVATVTTAQAEEAERFNKALFKMQKLSQDASRALVGDLVTGINAAAKAWKEGGLISGIQVLFTGDDQHKNNVKLVEQTSELLALEKDIASLRGSGVALDLAQARKKEERLKVLKEELKTTQAYRTVLSETEGVGSKPLPSLPDRPNKGKSEAQKDPDAEAKRYIESLQKQIEKTLELTNVQTLGFELNLGHFGKITQATQNEMVLLAVKADLLKAESDTKKELVKLNEESIKKVEAYVKAEQANQAALLESNTVLRAHIAEIGLSKEALNALELARIDDAIAAQQQAATLLQGQSGQETEIAHIERQISLLKEKRSLTAAGQIAQANADTSKEQADASKKYADDLHGDVKNALSNAFRDSKGPIGAFGDALGNVVFTRVTNALADSMVDGLLGNSKTGGGGLLSGIGAVLGFEGGGYTGYGARAGGLDGKGGFMAMLHPNETVFDHTRGQSAGGTVNININANVGDIASKADVVAGMRATASQIAAQINRSKNYGGAMA